MVATLIRLVLLTVMWAALQGSFDLGTLLLGILLSGAVLRLAQPVLGSAEDAPPEPESGIPRPLRRAWWVTVLILVFFRELVQSAVQVARYTVQPQLQIRPAVVAYPLDVKTDREITMLANLISLTPGTLSLDVSPDRSYLYVHSISVEAEDGRAVIAGIKSSLEKYVNLALGPQGVSVSLAPLEPSGEQPSGEGSSAESVEEGGQ